MITETMADFARRMESHMGRAVNRSTVKRWADSGRIVMVGDKVDVEASLAQLSGTQGGRQDVADRHAQEAAEKATAGRTGPDAGQASGDLSMDKARRVRAVAEARIKHAEAEMREMERDEMAGRLIAREDVEFVLDDFGATLRGLMENLADRLAPVVHPLQSMEETHAALAEAAQDVLQTVHDQLRRRAQERKQ